MLPDISRGLTVAATIIAVCMLGIAAIGAGFLWLAPVLTVGLAAAVLSLAVTARRHERLVRQFRAQSTVTSQDGFLVRVGAFAGAVFVGGLRRPEIFMDEAVLDTLSPDERRAVLLHEQSHLRRRDPLRMSIESLVRPLARRTASGRTWLIEREAAREIRADQYALEQGATAQAIAAALIKVHPVRLEFAGFTTVIDHRIAALTGNQPERPRRFRLWMVSGGLLMSVALCINALHLTRVLCCS